MCFDSKNRKRSRLVPPSIAFPKLLLSFIHIFYILGNTFTWFKKYIVNSLCNMDILQSPSSHSKRTTYLYSLPFFKNKRGVLNLKTFF